MSRAIAIETSGRLGSVALAEDGRVLAEEAFPHDLKHAAGVVSVIDRLTRSVGWTPREIQEVYVSAGPGSFTGLRVGVTVAKTLALALGARVVAVPSTEALAHNAPPGWRESIIVLDAKRGQIFAARYVNDAGRPVEAEAAHLDTLAGMLGRAGRPVHLIGEGIAYHRGAIEGEGVVETPEAAWRARAAVVAELGYAMARAGRFTEADRLTPTYIRRPEAEEKWEAKRQGDKGTS